MTKTIIISISILLMVLGTEAAIRKSSNILQGPGVIRGGRAGTGFSLLSVSTKTAASKKIERVQLEMGNSALQALTGSVGYFNIQNDPQSKKIIINLAQTLNTKFEENQLRQIFSKSVFIAKTEMIFDPQSQNMSLVLTTKKPTALRVQPKAGDNKKSARIILDIFEPSMLKKVSVHKQGPKSQSLKR